MEELKIKSCSISCLMATQPIEKCKCKCNGAATHGLLVERKEVRIECSPSAEKRCKNGEEGKECKCACLGTQHGLYHNIEGFENVKITGYQLV